MDSEQYEFIAFRLTVPIKQIKYIHDNKICKVTIVLVRSDFKSLESFSYDKLQDFDLDKKKKKIGLFDLD